MKTGIHLIVLRKVSLLTALFISFSLISIAQEQGTDTTVNLKPLGDTTLLRDTTNFDVVVKFTVEANGKIRNIEILKNNCRDCEDKQKKQINEEVMNIVRKNPIAPRKDKNGKARTTTYIQPIIFVIEEQ